MTADTQPARGPVHHLVGRTFIKSDDNSLVYNLKQDGWKNRKPFMVNDISISLSNVHDLLRRAIVAEIILISLNEVVEYENDMKVISDRLSCPPNTLIYGTPPQLCSGGKPAGGAP